MKTTILLHSNFSCLFVGKFFNGESKFILFVNSCSIDSVAKFLNRKVLIPDIK